MAGHSHASNVKHKKDKEDAKKTKLFTKLSREITVATRAGGKDPLFNPHLRIAIEKAKRSNMPKDNIDRSIKKGSGDLELDTLEEITYEGYAPGGVAIIVNTLTDNRNRTAGEMRYAFSKFGGVLGETGSVSWKFKKIAIFEIDKSEDEEKIIDFMIENDLEDMEEKSDFYLISCNANIFNKILGKIEQLKLINSNTVMLPEGFISLDKEKREKFDKIIEFLEDINDVQEVFSNIEA